MGAKVLPEGCVVFHCKARTVLAPLLIGSQCVGMICDAHARPIAHLDRWGNYIVDADRADGYRLVQKLDTDIVRMMLPSTDALSVVS